jgi:hypothetical protein
MTSPEHEPERARRAQGDPPASGDRVACRVEWSPDFRYCTATAHDRGGDRIVALTFASPDPCGDTIVRLRMETAAIAALHSMLAALRT